MVHNQFAPGLLLVKGRKAFELKNYQECARNLEKYLEMVPNNFKVKMTLIQAYLALGQLDKCLDYTKKLLAYDGDNPELHEKLYQILAEMMEKDSVKESRETRVATLINQTTDFFHAIEKEKSLLKSRLYSHAALGHISKVLSFLLRNHLEVNEWEKVAPYFTTIITNHAESTCLATLHIDYLSLLTIMKNVDNLVDYIENQKTVFSSNLHWLLAAREGINTISPTFSIQTKILSLSLAHTTGIYLFEQMAGQQEFDSQRTLLVQSMVSEISKCNIPQDEWKKEEQTPERLQEWIYCRQEMLACTKMFEGISKWSSLDLPIQEESKSAVLESLESLFIACSYVPDVKSPFPPFQRQASCLAHIKRIVYCLNIDWIVSVPGASIYSAPFLRTSTIQGDSFLDSIPIPNPSFKLLDKISQVKQFQKFVKVVELLDRPETSILAMQQDSFCTLKQMLDWCTWNLPLDTTHLKSTLLKMFPQLPKYHMMLEKSLEHEKSKEKISPRKNFKFDMKTTPSISDIHSFLILSMLERQVVCIDRYDPPKPNQFWLYTTFWSPSDPVSVFWSSLNAKYGRNSSSYVKNQLLVSKSILQGVQDLRGDSKYCSYYADVYGLIGSFLYKLYRKGNQFCLISAKIYLDLAKKGVSKEKKNGTRPHDSILSCTSFDRLGSIMDLDSSYQSRVEDHWSSCSMDISQLMVDNESKPASLMDTPYFKKRVSFEVSKSADLFDNQASQTPQMKTNFLPGFFPKTPQTPLVYSKEKRGVESATSRPSNPSHSVSVMSTPQLLKSVPGFFPKSDKKKGILKSVHSDQGNASFYVPSNESFTESIIAPDPNEYFEFMSVSDSSILANTDINAQKVVTPSSKEKSSAPSSPFEGVGVDWSSLKETKNRRQRKMELLGIVP